MTDRWSGAFGLVAEGRVECSRGRRKGPTPGPLGALMSSDVRALATMARGGTVALSRVISRATASPTGARTRTERRSGEGFGGNEMKTATDTHGMRGDEAAGATRWAALLRASTCAAGTGFIPFSGQKEGGVR
jgi:hypothetical protein